MRPTIYSTLAAILLIVTAGCKKNRDAKKTDCNVQPCPTNAATVRQIDNKNATVQLQGGEYFIIEQNTIDTRLRPCNLCPEFQVDDLQVIVSGDVKKTTLNIGQPCCTDDFVITKISK